MNSQENSIMAATFILKNLPGEIRNRAIGVTFRNIKIAGEYHLEEKGWLQFNILIPIGGTPENFKLKFIGRHNQYCANYYGVRDSMAANIAELVNRFGGINE